MSEDSAKTNYWQDLLSDVANDLDLMLDDLCQDLELSAICNNAESTELRSETLHEQSLPRLGEGDGRVLDSPSRGGNLLSGHPIADQPTTTPDGKNSLNDESFEEKVALATIAPPCSFGDGSSKFSSSGDRSNSSNFVVEISILERLICTNPIWFLPDCLRGGAGHLLQGKEIGNFIIRKSSKPSTMALTVRLPASVGPHIEHYLIEKNENGELHLEGSESLFTSVTLLVSNYCQCCDELPVRLTLPTILMGANSRQELLSYALLGQDFWSSAVANAFLSAPRDGEANPKDKPALPNPLSSSEPSSPMDSNQRVPEFDLTSNSSSSTLDPPLILPAKILSNGKGFPGPPPPIPTAPKPPLRDSVQIKNITGVEKNVSEQKNANVLNSIESVIQRKLRGSASHSAKSMLATFLLEQAVDSPGLYYHSSLADKASDYEDIWGGSSTLSEKDTKAFSTFKPPLSIIPEKSSSPKKENVYIQAQLDPKEMVSNWTQTEELSKTPLKNSPDSELKYSKQGSLSVQDIRCHNRSMESQSSPFYAEPIDSVATPSHFKRLNCHRHSDPNILSGIRRRKDSSMSSSWENLSVEKASSQKTITNCPGVILEPEKMAKMRIKTVLPKGGTTWEVDSSWEWNSMSRGEHNINPLCPLDLKFPLSLNKLLHDGSQVSDTTTVEDLIVVQSPELCCLSECSPTSSVVGASEYDNLDDSVDGSRYKFQGEHIDDAATEFSEPWDSRRWDKVLQMVPAVRERLQGSRADFKDSGNISGTSVSNNNEKNKNQVSELTPLINFDEIDSASASVLSSSTEDLSVPTLMADNKFSRKFDLDQDAFNEVTKPLSFRSQDSDVGEAIRQYICRLALEKNNTFGMAIENFIQCTQESTENNPTVVMRNIRQFMTGMKNYLLKNGEGQFDQLVQMERSKLKADEFLNIDAIVEGTLHKLVIKPLKNYIYQIFVDAYRKNGSLQLISENIKFARGKTKEEMGIKPEYQPPQGPSLEIVRYFLQKLQQEYSPIKKLESLLAAITTIYNCVQQPKTLPGKIHASLGADDFLPIFIFVLVRCGMISAEIEADFMWGLLQPSMTSGEGGYYLTTLSGAVTVLKSFQTTYNEDLNREIAGNQTDRTRKETQGAGQEVPVRLPCISDLQGFMKIMIPDELSGCIVSKTLPVRPNMSTKDVGKMIASKFKITNAQDYGLFKLVKGEENQLGDNESPQTVKADLLASGEDCLFAYKRCDANFIWPVLN